MVLCGPCREVRAAVGEAYEGLRFHEAAEAVMGLCTAGNQAITEAQPWTYLGKVNWVPSRVTVIEACKEDFLAEND